MKNISAAFSPAFFRDLHPPVKEQTQPQVHAHKVTSSKRSNFNYIKKFFSPKHPPVIKAVETNETVYANLIDGFIKFVENHANALQPPLSESAVAAIRNDFLKLKSHLFDEKNNFFSSHKEIMFGLVLENFNLLFKLIQNEKIPLQKRMTAIVDMAPSMGVCSGGINTAVQESINNLQHANSGIRSASHRFKIQLINSVINEHVLTNHSCLQINEVHFGNAYFNYIADDMGLKQRSDAFIKSIESEISETQLKDCKRKIMAQLRPTSLATSMADDYLSKIRDAIAFAGVDTSMPLEGQRMTTAFNTTKNITAASLDAEFGPVPFDNFLLPTSDDYAYQLAKKPALIARHFMEKLKSEKLVDYENVIQLTKSNDDFGAIMLLDDLFWINHQGDCKEMELTVLLRSSPIDIFKHLITQGIHKQQCFVILKSIAQYVFNDDTINHCDKDLKKWLNEITHIYKNTKAWDESWITPILLLAAKVDSIETLRILIKTKIDLSLSDADGQSALMTAAQYGCTEALRYLLKYGAKVDATDSNGNAALMYAVFFGQTEAAKLLIANNANIDAIQPELITPLLLAATRQKEDIVQLLIDASADLEFKCLQNTTALMEAVAAGNLKITEMLLKGGAFINACTNTNFTSAMIASAKGNAEMLGLLIDYGANLNSFDVQGKTVVEYAEQFGHTEILKNVINEKMLVAAEIGDEAKLQSLINASGDIEYKNSDGQTAAILASKNGNVSALLTLSKANPNINLQDNNGQTALMHAAINNKLDALRILIFMNADLNIVDHSGISAAMHAAGNFHSNALEILFKLGAK